MNKMFLVSFLCLSPFISFGKTFNTSNDSLRACNYFFDERNFNPDAVRYDQNNAKIFARLCNIVYEDSNTIEKIFTGCIQYGLKINFAFYHDKGQSTEYMFVKLKGRLVICFRGSESLVHFTGRGAAAKDWFGSDRLIHFRGLMSDTAREMINNLPIPPGQKGFRKRTRQMIQHNFFKRMDDFVAKNNIDLSKGIYITGHSLGAALAQFMIMPIMARYPKDPIESVYLFAPPLAIECSYAIRIQQILGSRIQNIVCERDYVVRGQLRCKAANMGFYYRIVEDTLNRTNKQYINAHCDMINTLFGPGFHHLETYLRAINAGWNLSDSVNVYRPYPIGDDPLVAYYLYPNDSRHWLPLKPLKSACACDNDITYNPIYTKYKQRFKILTVPDADNKKKKKRHLTLSR